MSFARGPRAGALPARARRQPPVPLARAPGAARVDARLRRHRPAPGARTTWAARRRSASSPARGSTCCWTSCPTTWPPTTRTRSGPTPPCASGSSTSTPRPGGTGASSPSTSWPACAWRTRRSSRPPTRSSCGWWPRAWWTGCASTTPTASPIPPGYLVRLAERGVERIWVEKIIEPGELLPDWPVEGTTGYEFMADATALFIDPAGEEPLTALYAELTGETRRDFEELAAEAKLDGGAHHLRARGRAPAVAARRARTWPRRSRPCRSTAPTWSPRRTQENDPHDVRGGGGGGPARARARGPRRSGGPRRGGVRGALPADHRGRHGQGRRGHRPLPLHPARRR